MDMSGIDAVIALRTQFPDARTIILSTFDCGAEIHRALAAGARFLHAQDHFTPWKWQKRSGASTPAESTFRGK
jgi:DNA-binding NarL/FixJ family response regulator